MGLEIIEITMDIEDRFGVYFPEEVAEKMETVGDVCDWVSSILEDRAGKCFSAHVFYRFRRAIIKVAGVPREQIRPDSLIADLISKRHTREIWRETVDGADFRLPSLRPSPLVRSILYPTLLGSLVGTLLLLAFVGQVGAAPVLVCGVLTAALVFARGALSTHLASDFRTVRDLVNWVAARGMSDKGQGRPVALSEEQIFEAIRAMIVEKISIDPARIRRESSWARDLGIG